MKKSLSLIGLIILMTLSACRTGSEKFLGTWHCNDYPTPFKNAEADSAYTFTITKNDKNFIMTVMGMEYPVTYDAKNDRMISEGSKGQSSIILDIKCNCLILDGLKYLKKEKK